jgi:hypothetical protein
MDEIFGYFPPVANPPSKGPLLTLLKQARAFGLGCVLATQNPVDIDYKGLGNAGTWFIGRLQTERDKARVIEGLLGSEAAGGLDKAGFEALMSNLTQRTFLMRNVHDDAPVLFRTRWALSYLRGPLTLAEIKRLKGARGEDVPALSNTSAGGSDASGANTSGVAQAGKASASTAAQEPAAASSSGRPVVQHGVTERFVATREKAPHYSPFIGARVRARYADSKAGLDIWQTTYYLAPLDDGAPDWARAEVSGEAGPDLTGEPAGGASFGDAPAVALTTREHKRWMAALEDHVYRNVALELPSCPSLKLTAAAGMSEGEFRSRVALALRENRDAAVEALRRKYAAKLATLEDRERRAQQKIEREKTQAGSQTLSSAIAVGGSLLGALFGGGRRGSSISKASSAARSVGRIGKERADVEHAEADARALREQIEAINAELEAEVARLEAEFDPAAARIEVTAVRPRKADIAVEDVALVWVP